MQYLSEEWMQATADALAASDLTAATPERDDAEPGAVVQYEVSGAPGGKARYALRFTPDGVTLDPGDHEDARARFTLDYDTAALIAQGELSAQAAFMQGRLKLGGDVTVLIDQHSALDGLADVLADVRDRTEY